MTIMTREDGAMAVVPPLLDEVGDILAQRRVEYGDGAQHHAATAEALRAIFGWDIDARKWCLALVVDKIVRAEQSPDKRDHYADIIGYTKLAHDRAIEDG